MIGCFFFKACIAERESEKIMNCFLIEPSMSSSAKRSARSSAEYIEDLSGNLIDFWAPLEKSVAAPTLSPCLEPSVKICSYSLKFLTISLNLII